MTWRDHLPPVAGRIAFDTPLAPYTWLRVGGPADVLYLPKDEADLEGFLKVLDPGVPLTMLGVGSNTLVRDGGIEGVVIRLGREFAQIKTVSDDTLYAGAAALDAQVSRVAAEAGIMNLEFYTGVPGTIGGALTMNAGCYGAETKDVLIEAYGLTRAGERTILSNADMGFSYRKAEAAHGDLIFTGALFRGPKDDPRAIDARMAEITARREAAQPIREKTGGSTFKNPIDAEGMKRSAWKLVDEAGWRGKLYGGAMFSPQHANFLINTGEATAADLEGLGETVRAEVLDKFGVELNWEIKRVGRSGPSA
jgi:UDP-N-acetylmuramate dehydrogenase